ncbi:CidA/LrgA family holin-like protein [Paenibacillus beijingensis]|uniref:Holin n=1 Tax=Paenibacillus beijingensis TaxID=1126833 RepID=A0A0D5NSP1_9BACL|nr:holin [Paenibacillus beijingensis]
MKTFLKGVLQVIFFIVVFWLMNGLSELLHLKVPGSILGLVLVFLLLQFKIIKVEWIDLGATWLLAEMLLFFIPPATGLIQFQDLLLQNGLSILLVIVSTTLIVMLAAGILSQLISHQRERKNG